jgi:hypothetical protein
VSILTKRKQGGRLSRSACSIAVAIPIAIASPHEAAAQHDPRVAPAPAYVISGATVHTLAGETIENGVILVRDGRIADVGPNVAVPSGAAVIDATGLHVYPGMVDAFSRLGLTEIGSVSATEDVNELGSWNPHLAAYSAIYPASEQIPVARANGITHALSAPGSGGGGFRGGGGGGIPGQATLIHLDGWTIEEMAIEPSAGMIIQWPTIQTRSFDFSTFSITERPFTEAKKEYDEQLQELEDWFEAAQHYKQAVEQGDPAKWRTTSAGSRARSSSPSATACESSSPGRGTLAR